MTGQDLVLETYKNYVDKYDMVTPGPNSAESANGLYFTAIFNKLRQANDFQVDFSYKEKVTACFQEPGLLMRNPDNTQGQEQFDNYLGVVLGCTITKCENLLKTILKYAAKHFFIMNTDNNLEFKDWLGRYPHLWMLMSASAYPIAKSAFYLPLLLICKFFKPSPDDMSGNLLQYVFISTFDELYKQNQLINWSEKVNKTVPEGMYGMFKLYFGVNHPFSKIVLSTGRF